MVMLILLICLPVQVAEVEMSQGGGGGGAIKIVAGGTLQIGADIWAAGGRGGARSNEARRSGGSGSGGAIYLKGTNVIIDSGVTISAAGGAGASGITGGNSWASDGGGAGAAAGGGGRVYVEATASLVNNASNTNANINAAGGVSPGFRHGTEGTVKILRPQVTSLVLTSGSLIIDTSQATITHSDGAFLSGTFEDRSYTHTDGTVYAYKVCVFTADEISLGSGVLVTLQGANPLSLRTRNHGDFTLSTQLIANGSDGDNGSTDTPGKIGGYAGARKGSYNGYGPGKGANRQENNDGTAGGYGNIGQKAGHTTATYGNIYGDYFLDDLLGGSGGGGGQYQGGWLRWRCYRINCSWNWCS